MKPCPRCGGGVALRGYPERFVRSSPLDRDPLSQIPYTHSCPHPCHAAAQAVVEAAVNLYGDQRHRDTLPEAVDALLKTLEPEPETTT